MKKVILFCFISCFIASVTKAQTTTVVNYDFNSGTSYPIQPLTTATNITCSGTSSEAFQTYTGTATTTSAFVQNTTAGNALAMANSGGTNTRYFIFQLGGSELNLYTGYKLFFEPQRSSTGATLITLAYSTNGSSYTNFGTTYTITTAFTDVLADLSSITALNNASSVYIKLMVSGASQTTGTIRIDNFQIQATKGTAPGTPWQVTGNDVGFPGKLGIGTLNPAYPLEVTGNSVFHGNHTVDGTINGTKLTTNKITYTDSVLHIGDSSITMSTVNLTGQPVTHYDRISNSSTALAIGVSSYASNAFSLSLGHSPRATGSNSIALGTSVISSGSLAIAIGNGNGNNAAGSGSITIGKNVKTDAAATNAITIGNSLTNTIPNSLMVGFGNSTFTTPSLFVAPTTSATPGFVGIGNSTPATALHVTGEVTISGMGNHGIRTLLVDNSGKLIYGMPSTSSTVNWALGGNQIANPTNEYFGTSNNSDLTISTFTLPRMTIKADGKIGFGGSFNPSADFEFFKDNEDCQVKLTTNNGAKIPKLSLNNGIYSADIYLGSNATSPSPIVMDWAGKHFLSFNNGNMLIGDPDNLVGDPASGGDIYTKLTISAKTSPNANFWNTIPLNIVNPDQAATDKSIFRVEGTGFTSIAINAATQDNALALIDRSGSNDAVNFIVKRNGTTYIGAGRPNVSGAYADAKLTVDGKILAKEVRVTVASGGTSAWADYVFEKNYKLMNLYEVEKFYKSEKHLPNVPSAKEVEANGIDMAEMNATLLRKIEENTIYLVELKKELDALKLENNELKKQIKK